MRLPRASPPAPAEARRSPSRAASASTSTTSTAAAPPAPSRPRRKRNRPRRGPGARLGLHAGGHRAGWRSAAARTRGSRPTGAWATHARSSAPRRSRSLPPLRRASPGWLGGRRPLRARRERSGLPAHLTPRLTGAGVSRAACARRQRANLGRPGRRRLRSPPAPQPRRRRRPAAARSRLARDGSDAFRLARGRWCSSRIDWHRDFLFPARPDGFDAL